LGVHDDYDPMKGVMSLKKGPVSFTRDKNYRVKGRDSEVRLTFDREKLKHRGYKIYPYVDRSVVKHWQDEDPLPQHEARWEAEEVIIGPVKLKDGLTKIEITKDAYDKELNSIKHYEKRIEENEKVKKQLDDGTFRWTLDYWKKTVGVHQTSLDMFEKFIKKAEEELKKDPKWMPRGFADRISNQIKYDKENVQKKKEVLSKVEVMK